MDNVKRLLLIYVCSLVFCPTFADAQFELLSPGYGAGVSTPPSLEWSPGENDYFLLYSFFPYVGVGYWPVVFSWFEQTSIGVTPGWWDVVQEGLPCYWGVVGYDLDTSTAAGLPPWTFTKTSGEPDMVSIPSGCFDMGDALDEGNADELPVHEVCVSAFEMDAYEVTNAEYADCVDAGACAPPDHTGGWPCRDCDLRYYGHPDYNDFPVTWVDWYQAQDYCTWVGKRLPTEAEWEYAGRGGRIGNRYPWGDVLNGQYANYLPSGDPWEYDKGTSPVEYHTPNGYGLFGMAGNVSEWVEDGYHGSYDCDANPGTINCEDGGVPPTDGTAWIVDPRAPATYGVVRGGSFLTEWYEWSPVTPLRVAARVYQPSGEGNWDIGFRCAR